MKKLLVIVTLTSFLAACNNGGEEKATATTDTLKSAESPLMDAVNTADSLNKKIQDSTVKMMDTMMKK